MELETQVQVSGNQLRRQDEDNKRLKEEIENLESQQKELHSKLREQQHRYSDLESKVRVYCLIVYFYEKHKLNLFNETQTSS